MIDRARGAQREAAVASGGRFQFAALPTGDYSLRIESAGLAAYVMEQIHLSVGESVREDARLSLATQHETVIVEGGAEAIDLATNTLGKTVTERET